MKRLKILSLSNEYHFFAIVIILIAASFVNHFAIIILLIYLFFCYKKTMIFNYIILISILFGVLLLYKFSYTSKISKDINFIEVKCVDYVKTDNNYKLTCRYKFEKIIVYTNAFEYKCGDYLSMDVKSLNISTSSYKGDFDYSKYLKNKGIYNSYEGKNIKIIKRGFSFKNIRYKIIDYINITNNSQSKPYILSLVLGDKNYFDENYLNNINKLGVSHLYSISGLHINIIFNFLYFFFKKIFFKENKTINVILFSLFIYMIILDFLISAIRTFLMILFSHINKNNNLNLTKIDIISICFILTILVKPMCIYEISTQLSYLLTFGMILCSDIISDKNKIKNLIKMTIFCYFLSFPIVINLNHEINFIGLIISPLIIVIFTYIILPTTYISLIIPLNNIFLYFEIIINMFSNISFLRFNIPHITFIQLCIYYFLLYILLFSIVKNKYQFKVFLSIILYLLVINNLQLVDQRSIVTFIDVGQGDSIYIQLPNNKGNIMIDSYGKNVKFLKSKGVNKLDILILTHADDDHVGTLSELYDNVKVKKTYINYFDEFTQYNGINKSKEKHKVKSGQTINISDYKLDVLSPIIDSKNDNDNSIVIYFNFGIKYLFCGDMEINAEKKLIDKYKNKLDIDVLKVGHHGSKTSSSAEFLQFTSPIYSVISVGLNNKFGLPNNEVINRLNKTIVYTTKDSGNIDFIYKNNNLEIKTYR